MSKNIEIIIYALFGWLLLIFFFGYTLGVEDQQELLPYILHLKDTSLYPTDFFIQSLAAVVPNERIAFAYMLMPFAGNFEFWLLLFHCISTVFLLTGIYKIATQFIKNEWWIWMIIYSSLSVFYLYTLGGCDLYYNTFESSNLAKAMAVWAIYFYLKEKYNHTFIMLSIITYIQIIVGLDLAIILLGIFLIKKDFKSFFKFSLIYGILAGVYLVLIIINRPAGSPESLSQYFDILFVFRHPHHFMMSSFPLRNIVFIAVCSIVGLYYFFSRNITLFYFFLIVAVFTILNAICIDVLHFTAVANLNWYKNTIWIKIFGMIAIGSMLESNFSRLFTAINFFKVIFLPIIFVCSIVLFYGLILTDKCNIRHQTIHVGSRIDADPMIDISRKIKANTSKDAQFIVPFDATGFKYWSERNTYVDFKANTRTPDFTAEWYKRVKSVYKISMDDKAKGFDLRIEADTFYSHHYFCSLTRFKSKKVQYFLCPSSHPAMEQYEPPFLSNGSYKVYKID
jgi:hypothetical protein